jgi:hypothetical protein
LEAEFEEEISIKLTATPIQSSRVGVQEEKKLNNRSPLGLVELEESE